MNKYQEALEHIETLFTDNSYYKQFTNSFVPFNEDKEALYELIDKEDKYRWHDLEKDPTDLPNVSKSVLVFYAFSTLYCKGDDWETSYHYSTANYNKDKWELDKHLYAYDMIDKTINIIAWKEIKEFKDE